MSDQEQDRKSHPFHEEAGAIVFDKPKSQQEIARERRESEQHEFARNQVKTNKKMTFLQGFLVVGTFIGTGIGIWQATISQISANAAKQAVDIAQKTLAEATRNDKAQETQNANTLNATIRQAQLDERAWVSIKSVTLTKPYSTSIEGEIGVSIANTGKTPALKVGISQVGYSTDGGSTVHFSKPVAGMRSVQPPGGNENMLFISVPKTPEGTKIYVRFILEYWDVFQTQNDPPRTSTFCGYYPSGKVPFFFNCPDISSDMR